MGEITANAELENPVDRAYFERGHGVESDICTGVEAVVDTGTVILVLPQNVVERLSVTIQRTVVVTHADERKEERPVLGPMIIRIGNRFMSTDCVVGPPLSEPLVGQIVMEALDLVSDCANGTPPAPAGVAELPADQAEVIRHWCPSGTPLV